MCVCAADSGQVSPDSGDFTLVQVMAMEATSDKDSDGSPEEDNEGKEKTQEKKKSSKVCTSSSNF